MEVTMMSSTETVATTAAIVYAVRSLKSSTEGGPAAGRAELEGIAREASALFEAVEQEGANRIGSMKVREP
jgi:hypothetical protein